MKDLEITVNKLLVYNEVAMSTAYEGAKNASYEQVFTTDADRLKLELFWSEGCNKIIFALGSYLTAVTVPTYKGNNVDLSDFVVTLTMPDTFNSIYKNAIMNDMISFLSHYVCAKWYVHTKRDMVDIETQAYETTLEELKSHLSRRISNGFARIKPSTI